VSLGGLIRYTSIGLLRYSFDPRSNEPKLHVDIDSGIAEMYRALVPKAVRLQRPKFAPHISVVRKEPVPRLDLWGVFEGREIEFEYEPTIYNDEIYYWLRENHGRRRFRSMEDPQETHPR
jgi:hypothetical protein